MRNNIYPRFLSLIHNREMRVENARFLIRTTCKAVIEVASQPRDSLGEGVCLAYNRHITSGPMYALHSTFPCRAGHTA